jgi:glucose-6-phosphate dehydrogenase assembly protein OpcA
MAPALVKRALRPSSPDTIDADLAAIWQEVARERPVARAVLSNLVVLCHRAADTPQDLSPPVVPPVEEVARRHPSRVIVLYHDPAERTESAPFAASVSVVTFDEQESRYGVEQIVVRSACSEASMPSIVRRLTLGSVPTSIWWTDDLSGGRPLQAIVTMGRQFVYDSRRWRDVRSGVLALEPWIAREDAADLADLNWRRLTTLRQVVLHGVDSHPPLALRHFRAVHVRYRVGEEALAWLLVGWIEAQLEGTAQPHLTIEEDPAFGDEVLTMIFGESAEMAVTLTEHAVVAQLGRTRALMTAARPQAGEADAVAAELHSLARDICLRDALKTLMRRFGSA